MKCHAHIRRTFKTAKAESLWPNHPMYNEYPECGGEIKGRLVLTTEPEWGGGGVSTAMELKLECTHCKDAYHEVMIELTLELMRSGEKSIDLDVLTRLIAKAEDQDRIAQGL